MIELTAELRQFYLKSHFTEELEKVCPGNEISLVRISPRLGTYKQLYQLATERLPYEIANILLVDKESEYAIGTLSTDCFITSNQKQGLFDS